MSHHRFSVSLFLSSVATALCGCATSSRPPIDEARALATMTAPTTADASSQGAPVRTATELTHRDDPAPMPNLDFDSRFFGTTVPFAEPRQVPADRIDDMSAAELAARLRAPAPLPATASRTGTATPAVQGRDDSDDWRGSGHFLVGWRHFFDEGWGDLDDQPVVGIEFEFRPPNSGLGFEFGAQASADFENNVGGAAVDLFGLLAEIYAGPRFTFDVVGAPIHPYIGAGVTVARARVEVIVGNGDDAAYDTTVAGYGHAGLLWEVTQHFDIGIDVRGTFGGDVDVAGGSVDTDYVQGTLFMGASW